MRGACQYCSAQFWRRFMCHGLLNTNHDRCFTPKTLEIVISAFLWQKSVNNDIAIIDKYPPVVGNSFGTPGADAVHSLGLVTDVLDDCL